MSPADHPVSQYEFDVLIGADGKRNTLDGEFHHFETFTALCEGHKHLILKLNCMKPATAVIHGHFPCGLIAQIRLLSYSIWDI